MFLVLDGDNDEKIANSLEDFFASKVSNIYNDILSKQSSTSVPHSICSTTKHAFRKFEYKELKQIVLAIPSRSCEMDPIPIWLFKECFHELSTISLSIVNELSKTGKFPDILKSALVTHILRKPELDADILSNYCVISNLTFVRKIIESVFTQSNSVKSSNYMGRDCFKTY